MQNLMTMTTTKVDDAFDLGSWIGRKQAFAELAGRCSAADAECLRQVRNRKKYRALKMTWAEFCRQRVGISRVTADKIIDRLEEFGPQYFLLAQATGIKPDEYRRISGSVRGQALLCAGEEIPINAENAPRLTAAIEELRRGPSAGDGAGESAIDGAAQNPAEAKVQAELEREFERATRAANVAAVHFKRLVDRRLENRRRLIGELGLVVSRFRELEKASWD